MPCPVIGDAAVALLCSAAAAAAAGSSSFSSSSSVLLHGGTSAMPSARSRSAYQNILDDPPFDSPFSTGETA